MKEQIFTREEFIAKTQVSEENLTLWEKNRLVRPVGYTDDQTPIYSQQAIEQVLQIHKLQELGYDLDGIQKIIKKVGLPTDSKPNKEPSKGKQYLTVGNLAERIGVSPRTLKHWEDKGIIVADMRSEGGFRLYAEHYVYLCNLIQDLQLFGYSLEEIKIISDYFREFLQLNASLESMTAQNTETKLNEMSAEIDRLMQKIDNFKEGIQRWEDLLKNKKKELQNLKNRNQKRKNDKNEKKDKKNG